MSRIYGPARGVRASRRLDSAGPPRHQYGGAQCLALAQVSVLVREQFPVPLGDDLDGTVDHFEGGLVVDRVRGA